MGVNEHAGTPIHFDALLTQLGLIVLLLDRQIHQDTRDELRGDGDAVENPVRRPNESHEPERQR